jgi:O-antigen/teichoic acid export membrane protein
MHWITMLAAGAVATGLYSACLSIVALANPFLFGYFNILTPRFVRVFKEGGAAALRRRAVADVVLLGAGMGLFTLAIWVFGSTIMNVLFPGEDYRGATGLLTVLALSCAAGALGGPAVVALSVAERGRPIAILSVAICVLTSILVFILMSRWGLDVAVYGILAGECLGSLARWMLFLWLVPTESVTAQPHQMLRHAKPPAATAS